MNLMTLVRLLVLLVVGWTAVSLGAGVLGLRAHAAHESTFFLPRPALEDAMAAGRLNYGHRTGYRLLDRTNGQVKSLTLPKREDWSLLSVSPWRDKDGNLEAAGRWVTRGDGDGAFCGVGCLTLPSLTLKNRVTLDVLPTGKPCWVSARPGEILFPGGDGRLYRCNITGRDRENQRDEPLNDPLEEVGNVVTARAVTWEGEIPGAGVPTLADPAVLPEPGLSHLVIVALGIQERRNDSRVNLASKLWWLAMNEEGDAIVNAGRLTEPDPDDSRKDCFFERLPNVVSRADGKLSLVYLTRLAPATTWQLQSSTLEIDPQTSLPRLVPGAGPMVLAKELRADPLVVSAKGDSVYAIDSAGQIVEHSIPR